MRVITLNMNGIRAAGRKGFFEWMQSQDADFICLQETKAQMQHLPDAMYRPEGYHCAFHCAQKKGYSGVGLYARREPDSIQRGLGWPCADDEGRYIQFDYPDLSIASIYLPSGSSGDERQAHKFDFMQRFMPHMDALLQAGKPFILCGDLNIVHKEIDIKNFKPNRNRSGCLPSERAWLDDLFEERTWVDAFRVVDQRAEQYTWWSNRGRSWDNNVGWRIDYQVVTPDMRQNIKQASIYKEQRFSDHAPLIVDYAV